jgi:hypothetical protein
MISETVALELQGVGVLGDGRDLVVGLADGVAGGDLHTDLQFGAVGDGEVLDDLLREPGEVTGVAVGADAGDSGPPPKFHGTRGNLGRRTWTRD